MVSNDACDSEVEWTDRRWTEAGRAAIGVELPNGLISPTVHWPPYYHCPRACPRFSPDQRRIMTYTLHTSIQIGPSACEAPASSLDPL